MGELSQQEADKLLELLKKCVDTKISMPSQGFREDLDVYAIERRNEKFIISINRRNSVEDKVSFVARYLKDNTILLRLDIAPTAPHKNPPGFQYEEIQGTHLHIYREGYESKYAMPFDVNDELLEDKFLNFLNMFNVIEKPVIICQTEISGN